MSHVLLTVRYWSLIINWSLPFYFAPQVLRPLTLSNCPHCIYLWWPLHCEEESKIYFDPWKMKLAPNYIHQKKVTGSSSGGNQKPMIWSIFLCWKPNQGRTFWYIDMLVHGYETCSPPHIPAVTCIIIVPPSRNQNISARLPQTSMRFQLSTYWHDLIFLVFCPPKQKLWKIEIQSN